MQPGHAPLLPRPRQQPSMEEQQKGHKLKKETEVGTERERRGMERVEWLRERE